ncbi:hypothetical protein [Burkholderia anthina]|uniref:hypothetical protein n=1 Tax=Burkholderia anthina TaxID=179879 RepID=UPI000B2AADC7|nr:hypothetical protein [Burkholderia anthina]
MAKNRWRPGDAGLLLRDQQSVECFAAREKHRFLITKARLLRNLQWRGSAAAP